METILERPRKIRGRAAARLIIIASLLGAGCATLSDKGAQAGLQGFPIGIYNVADPGHLAILKKDGFDAFLPAPKDAAGYAALAKEARRLGMSMVIQHQPFIAKPASAVKSWPVLAWYLQDEPEVNKVKPETLAQTAAAVKSWDPSRLQTFVVGTSKVVPSYASIADALMLDWYPVPHLLLSTVTEHLEAAQRALPKEKPVWMVLQAFDWSEDGSSKGFAVVTRFPTYEEIRYMSYASILAGARGLFYFRLPVPPGETLLDYPERWQSLARVTRELKLFKPVLEGGKPAPLPFPPNPDGPNARAWSHGGRSYVVLANHKKSSFLKVPEGLLDPAWRPLFALRREQKELLKELRKGWYLKPYQVLVLEGPPQDSIRTW